MPVERATRPLPAGQAHEAPRFVETRAVTAARRIPSPEAASPWGRSDGEVEPQPIAGELQELVREARLASLRMLCCAGLRRRRASGPRGAAVRGGRPGSRLVHVSARKASGATGAGGPDPPAYEGRGCRQDHVGIGPRVVRVTSPPCSGRLAGDGSVGFQARRRRPSPRSPRRETRRAPDAVVSRAPETTASRRDAPPQVELCARGLRAPMIHARSLPSRNTERVVLRLLPLPVLLDGVPWRLVDGAEADLPGRDPGRTPGGAATSRQEIRTKASPECRSARSASHACRASSSTPPRASRPGARDRRGVVTPRATVTVREDRTRGAPRFGRARVNRRRSFRAGRVPREIAPSRGAAASAGRRSLPELRIERARSSRARRTTSWSTNPPGRRHLPCDPEAAMASRAAGD